MVKTCYLCLQTVSPCEMFLQLRVSDLLRTEALRSALCALRQDAAPLSELDQINFCGCDVWIFFLIAHDRLKLIFWSFEAFS